MDSEAAGESAHEEDGQRPLLAEEVDRARERVLPIGMFESVALADGEERDRDRRAGNPVGVHPPKLHAIRASSTTAPRTASGNHSGSGLSGAMGWRGRGSGAGSSYRS